jgi:hypothetical protein
MKRKIEVKSMLAIPSESMLYTTLYWLLSNIEDSVFTRSLSVQNGMNTSGVRPIGKPP